MNPSSSRTRSWKISIQSKSRFFNIRLTASNFRNGGAKISFFLHLRRFFLLSVRSENRDRSRRELSMRSRIFRFVGRLFRRKKMRTDLRVGSQQRNRSSLISQIEDWIRIQCRNCGHVLSRVIPQKLVSMGSVAAIAGSLSLLCHSTSENNSERIITIHALSLFFYLILLFKMKKTNCSLLLVAITIFHISFSLSCLSYACTDLITNAVLKALNNIISIGFSTLVQEKCHQTFLQCFSADLGEKIMQLISVRKRGVQYQYKTHI